MAKKKTNPLIIIIIGVALFLFVQSNQQCVDEDGVITCGDSGLFAVSTKSSLDACNERRSEKDAGGFCVSDCRLWTTDIMYCADYHTHVDGSFSSYYDTSRIGKYFFQYEENCPPYNSIREENLYQCTYGSQTMPAYPICLYTDQCGGNEVCDQGTLRCVSGPINCGDGICGPDEGSFSCPSDCQNLVPNSCGDTDGGINYNVKGVVVKVSSNGQGRTFYNERCLDQGLQERYCLGNEVKTQIHVCENGCDDGRCLSASCDQAGDANCDGVVSKAELIDAILEWSDGQITKTELIQAILAWAGG